MNAAGIALLSGNCVLLLKRGTGGDHPGEWCFPGGKVEEGEFVEDAARRETLEEVGYTVMGAARRIGHNEMGDTHFTTFAKNVPQFEPVLNEEHTEFMWAPLDALPEPMHPGVLLTLESDALDQINPDKLTETEVARLIVSGELDSPQKFLNMHLFAMRITGTGTAYRSSEDSFVYRPPEHYLNDEFLARCNGLEVIYEHPAKNLLNSEEFADRAIGSILLPYIQGEEVWGIAKIYDETAIEEMLTKQMSTSPTVFFRNLSDNSTIKLDNGEALLIEGKPSLLDHLAVCSLGVWDKGGEPAGVLNSTIGATDMTPEEYKAKADEFEAKAKADADEIAQLKAKADSLQAKADAMEASMPAAMQTAADKAKADADEEAEKKAKADADEEEAKKAKADSAAVQARIADMEARMPKVLSDADVAKIADTQSKADSVCRAFGDSAPAPVAGESVLGYRKRLIARFKDHSPSWKAVPLEAISDAVIDIAEKQIYADAATAARTPGIDVGAGLREVISKSRAGHEISTFVGRISDFTGQFKNPVRKFVTQINKPTA